jgi:hypothetical protein
VTIALDATYSLGRNLSVSACTPAKYSSASRAPIRKRVSLLLSAAPIAASFAETLPWNASRSLLTGAAAGDLFHALNQRVDFPRGSGPRRVVSTFHDLFVMTGDYSSPDFRAAFHRAGTQRRRAQRRRHRRVSIHRRAVEAL